MGIVRRCDFVMLAGGALAWPLDVRAQRSETPVIGLLASARPDQWTARLRAFAVPSLAAVGAAWGPVIVVLGGAQHHRPVKVLRGTRGLIGQPWLLLCRWRREWGEVLSFAAAGSAVGGWCRWRSGSGLADTVMSAIRNA